MQGTEEEEKKIDRMDDPQNETSDQDLIVKVEIPVDEPPSTPREIACGHACGHQHGLTRQQSMSRATPSANCLCSPTTHVGSFRCRLHRSPSLNKSASFKTPSLQRTRSSLEYGSSSPRPGRMEATSKPAAS
ncbi:uncharacterized protein LOC126792392 [Argentina anserina]|uniref:uncharacterized protein LOC126792392 n=1 Tax=Argentina anserina TaxID=57926 RepID=UPI0021761EEB|nr:uncharacterized protein LOC126792392 [Potentilla anserina]